MIYDGNNALAKDPSVSSTQVEVDVLGCDGEVIDTETAHKIEGVAIKTAIVMTTNGRAVCVDEDLPRKDWPDQIRD